jgi:pimeloyl-ACP methyl ester carboxylesterase
MPYAPVNGLSMYYEIHGEGDPLVLLHGALSATGTSFGEVLPELAKKRRVVAVEQQAHGRTADVDRPLSVEQMAEDTAALLRHIGVERADVFGYSMGSAIALELGVRHPELVRKLVLASISYSVDGLHPGLLEGIEGLQPEHLAGTPWAEEYARIAPNPGDWPALLDKVKRLDRETREWPASDIRALQAPTLIIVADSDIVRPEHAVEMFRLLGGGVSGDTEGMPRSQLAMLPGTAHSTVPARGAWMAPMIDAFLDAPMA